MKDNSISWKKILASAFTKNPSHLILHVTNRCNLKCRTCFVDFTKDKELTLNEIGKIAKYFKLVWLDIGGGEPFLRKDLPEICGKFDAKSVSIPTNGFNPKLIYETTKKIRERISAELSIAVSIDGFENTHNDIRGKGFRESVETLKMLKRIEGIRIKVNTVLCERNYDEIIDFMEYIRTIDVDFHSIIFLRGSPRDASFRLPSYDKLVKIKDRIFKIWDTYDYGFKTMEKGVLRNYQRCMYESSLEVIKRKTQTPPCLAGKKHTVVYANGDVAFCEMLPPFGNLRDKNIKELLKSKKAEQQRKMIKSKGCYCHHNCNMLDNYFLSPSQYPKLLGVRR